MAPNSRITMRCDGLSDVSAFFDATSHQDILRLTVDRIQRYGLSFITVWSPRPNGAPLMESLDLNTRPTAFVERYIRNEVFRRDPILLAMFETRDTLTWSEAMSCSPRSRAERAIVNSALEFGANDGLTMPIYMQKRLVSVFSVCGLNPNLSPEARNALKVIGLVVHQMLAWVDMVDVRRGVPHFVLTPRERHVLQWVARGKTNWEIERILDMGEETVKTLLSRAQRKLGASNRTGAAVQALLLGELYLDA